VAMLGVPVDAGESLQVSLRLRHGGQVDTISRFVPVRPSLYPSETLSVPPAYVKPDSISARRIQAEIAQSQEVSRKSHDRRRLWREGFVLPRSSRITSRFGTARV
jgi:hypothetical protein